MLYNINDPLAALECERQRTGNYGEDMFNDDDFPHCCDRCETSFEEFDYYYELGDEILCEECAQEWLEEHGEIK